MKIVGIENSIVITIFDWAESKDDVSVLPEGVLVENAPDYVVPGWIYDNEEYHAPERKGRVYDYDAQCYYSHKQYREILHQRTSNDTLQALRKLREGDQSYDWQAWLNKLDAYNKAVEETKNQATYPESVTYPQYPSR